MTGAQRLRGEMKERQWQALVVDLARALGWRHYHTHDSRRSEPGFPDLVLVQGERLVFAELKAERGRTSPTQEQWLAALAATGAETYLWRPSDWDRVTAVLQGRETE